MIEMSGSSQAKGLLGAVAPAIAEPRGVALLRRIDRTLATVEAVALTFVLIAIVFVGVYQLVRVHWLKPAPYWTREVIKYCVLFIGMVAGALAAQSERLFNIDMFTRAFGPRGRLVVRIVSALFCAWICLMYIRGGTVLLGVLADEKGEVISPATGMLALPAGAALIGLHMLLHAAIDAYYLASGRPSPDSAEGAPKL